MTLYDDDNIIRGPRALCHVVAEPYSSGQPISVVGLDMPKHGLP